MTTELKQYTEDHRYLLEAASRQAGLTDPVAIEPGEFYKPLLKAARKGQLLPIDDVLIRDWDPDNRRFDPGIQLGMRLYELDGIRFVRVRFPYHDRRHWGALDFVAVDRKDYRRLYKLALQRLRDSEPRSLPPVLTPEQA